MSTYLVMELADDQLLSLFAAWRAQIDSAPFAHQAECDKLIRAMLNDYLATASALRPDKKISCSNMTRPNEGT